MSSSSSRIKDIAHLAGVSIGTVDRVLHKRGKVSQESLIKVEAALAQLQYRPNVLASSLSRKKNFEISVLIPDSSRDEYWKMNKLGILKEADKWSHFGCQVRVTEFNNFDHQGFTKILEGVIESMPDGLVLAPIHYEESLAILKELQPTIPVTLFNANIEEINPLCFVGQDLVTSGRVAAHLIYNAMAEGGKIAIIHADEDFDDAPHLQQKERGFLNFFKERDRLNRQFNFSRLTNISENQLPSELKSLIETDGVKAIYVTTSNGTSLVGNALSEIKTYHPIVVGYDLLEKNISLLQTGTIRFLINQNPQLLGALALSNMLNSIVHNKSIPKHILFPIDIVTSENLTSYIQYNNH